jgi:hypothetical protein
MFPQSEIDDFRKYWLGVMICSVAIGAQIVSAFSALRARSRVVLHVQGRGRRPTVPAANLKQK